MAHKVIDFYSGKEVQVSELNKSAGLNQWNEFDSAEEAFDYMIANKEVGSIVLGWILLDIEKSWKPFEVGGLEIAYHHVWNNHLFFLFGRFCSYVGELKNPITF